MMKNIVLYIVGILILPIVINIIIGSENPTNIGIIGDDENWLSFYGSYMGGVLTAIIGFITLCKQARQNKIQLEIRSKEEALKELKLNLAERISLFNFTRIIEISLFYNDRKVYNTIQKELSEYQNLLVAKANAWACIYTNSKQKEVIQFKNSYIECYKEFTDAINSITLAIHHLSAAKTDEDITRILDKEITPINHKSPYIQEKLQNLFEAAQMWIRVEEDEITALKELL